MSPHPPPDRPDRARRYSVEERRAVLTDFFTRWPGDDRHPLGLGKALLEFQEWEILSGRIDDAGGSPWWSTVNGWLVADLEAASSGSPGPWAEYARAVERGATDLQARLWRAHQDSIEAGADAAASLLDDETDAERAFAELALAVVEMAAAAGQRTSSGALGRHTRESYPRRYPCTGEELDRLRAAQSSTGP